MGFMGGFSLLLSAGLTDKAHNQAHNQAYNQAHNQAHNQVLKPRVVARLWLWLYLC